MKETVWLLLFMPINTNIYIVTAIREFVPKDYMLTIPPYKSAISLYSTLYSDGPIENPDWKDAEKKIKMNIKSIRPEY